MISGTASESPQFGGMSSDVHKLDCVHWLGRRPCQPVSEAISDGCSDCSHYENISHHICIIRGSNLGGVLRTTGLAKSIKNLLPSSRISWVAESKSLPIIELCPSVDNAFSIDDSMQLLSLAALKFDVCINLDQEPHYRGLFPQLEAVHCLGFRDTGYGGLHADHGFSKLIDFRVSQPSERLQFPHHQALLIQALREFPLFSEARPFLYDVRVEPSKSISDSSVDRILVNPGVSANWETKSWPLSQFFQLTEALLDETELCYNIEYIIGPDEVELRGDIEAFCNKRGRVSISDSKDSISALFSLVSSSRLLITSDTFLAHVGLAVGTPTVVLFGSTASTELPNPGFGKFLVPEGLDCWPCYMKEEAKCIGPTHLACLEYHSIADVLRAIKESLND